MAAVSVLTVFIYIIMAAFLAAQLILLMATVGIYLHTLIKYILLHRDRRRQQSKVTSTERASFYKKILFLLIVFPLPIISILVEVFGLIAVGASAQSALVGQVFFNLLVFASFGSSFYLLGCLIYVAFVFLNIIKQVRQLRPIIHVLGCTTLVISLVSILLVTLFTIAVLLVTLNIKASPTITMPLVVTAVSLQFWSSYWICTVVLILGIIFYFSILQHAKKASMQVIIFLSIMVISALIQSLGNLLGQLSTVDSIFVVLFFAIQRLSEVAFMVGLVFLYAPLNSLGQISKTITQSVMNTADKLANGTVFKKKEEGGEGQTEVVKEEVVSVATTEEIIPPIENNLNVTKSANKIELMIL